MMMCSLLSKEHLFRISIEIALIIHLVLFVNNEWCICNYLSIFFSILANLSVVALIDL